jgi:peptidoglycan/LPS O-acetylase OafA/YrhL
MDAIARRPAAAPTASATTRYRPEIDGLRALAVVAVILTHLRVPGFSGGFLGVDVFFVVSGYLIHGDLVARAGRGTFSATGFYGRRLRRTLPALFVVLAASLMAATALLLPGDFTQAARGLIAAALLVPNLLFLTQSGYFDHPATLNPLLHTWSLGVEAQFYLLWSIAPRLPGFLDPTRRVVALIGLAALSLVLGVGLLAANPTAAFFLMPTRLWEFAAGCLLAERALPAIATRWRRELLAAGGLVVLLACMALFSSATPHPSPLTLAPCLATAALIQAMGSGETLVGALARSRAPVFLGLISYSLYLWHWPLIVFARDAGIAFKPAALAIGGAALLVVSTLSYVYVETPFRRAGSTWRSRALPVLGAGAVALCAAGLCVLAARGLPGRVPADVAAIADFYDYAEVAPYREGTCFITSRERAADFEPGTCLTLDSHAKNVLLIGDSHAAHLWRGLRDTWPGVNFLQATASGCKPLTHPVGAARCMTLMRAVLTRFLARNHVDAVILAALWEPDDLAALRDTIAYLKPLTDTVDVIGPMPRYDEPVSRLLAESLMRHDDAMLAAHRLASVPALDARMADEIGPIAHYVSAYRAMCPDDRCLELAAPGVPMQFDYHHLTKQGADRLMAILRGEKALGF